MCVRNISHLLGLVPRFRPGYIDQRRWGLEVIIEWSRALLSKTAWHDPKGMEARIVCFDEKRRNLVRFAHNWNNGTMEWWNIGFLSNHCKIMWYPFKRIPCQCTFCGHTWRIPQGRILRFERFFEIKKGQPFFWECHDCHEGVVIPGTYKNIHAETRQNWSRNPCSRYGSYSVLTIIPLFHYSIIP